MTAAYNANQLVDQLIRESNQTNVIYVIGIVVLVFVGALLLIWSMVQRELAKQCVNKFKARVMQLKGLGLSQAAVYSMVLSELATPLRSAGAFSPTAKALADYGLFLAASLNESATDAVDSHTREDLVVAKHAIESGGREFMDAMEFKLRKEASVLGLSVGRSS